MEESSKIIDVKIIDLNSAACAVSVYRSMKKIMRGENLCVACIMTKENNSECRVVVSGHNIRPTNRIEFGNAIRKSTNAIHYMQDNGIESFEFIFQLMR